MSKTKGFFLNVCLLGFLTAYGEGNYVVKDNHPTSFSLYNGEETETYYLHHIAYKDLSTDLISINAENIINHSIEAFDGQIYIAKNIQKGQVDVYDALTLESEPAIKTNFNYDSNRFSGDIFLTKDDENQLIAFYEPKIPKYTPDPSLINLLCEPLQTENDTQRTASPLLTEWYLDEDQFLAFSSPLISGVFGSDEYHLAFGINYKFQYTGDTNSPYVIKYTLNDLRFKGNSQIGETYVNNFYKTDRIDTFLDGYYENMSGTLSRYNNYYFWTTNGHPLSVWYRNISSMNCGSFPANQANYDQLSNGVHVFTYDGVMYMLYGADCTPNKMTYQLAQVNDVVSLVDINHYYDYEPSARSLNLLTTIDDSQRGWSNPYNRMSNNFNKYLIPFQLAQTQTISKNGEEMVLLHTYIPGVSLSSYLLNKQSSLDEFNSEFAQKVDKGTFEFSGNIIKFSSVQSSIKIYDLLGRIVAQNDNSDELIIKNCCPGTYILVADKSRHKINLLY